jgi:ligand-binding sensor domain-containing protein
MRRFIRNRNLRGALWLLLMSSFSGRAESPVPWFPSREAVFTSTRSVTDLAFDGNGELWVGTTGGILRRDSDGRWDKFTRMEGLSAHEVRSLAISRDGTVEATFPTARARWDGSDWKTETESPKEDTVPLKPGETCRPVSWKQMRCVGTTAGLQLRSGKRVQTLPFPPDSMGTHASALCPNKKGTLLVAIYEDVRLWETDGKTWTPGIELPAGARGVTALAESRDTVVVGTRREGVWRFEHGKWSSHLTPDEPYSHNVQALAQYRGSLYVSTLEDGFLFHDRDGWKRVEPSLLSSDAPRQLVEFQGALYVRHGNGDVDRLRDGNWTRNCFSAALPRKKVSAMASDGYRLYLAQWGGWSEWDGRTWTHFLNLEEFQGLTLTALCPVQDPKTGDRTLWVGTQGRGLAEVDAATGHVRRWHDARNGLTDDWITVLYPLNGHIYAGTFVGGLVCKLAGENEWRTFTETKGEAITALASDSAGKLWVGTRHGAWKQSSAFTPPTFVNAEKPFLDTEIQAILPEEAGIWIGTRTGLFFIKG